MATWIVLLRAVNVGGRMLPMTELRSLLTGLGHTGVATYIQSGNAILKTSRRDRGALADEIAAAIEAAHGLVVTVIMRTPAELRAVLETNPFRDVAETARVVVTFLSRAPAAADAKRLEPERFPLERFELHGAEIFVHYPNGVGVSTLTLDYFEKRLRVRGTARNVNTVNKLIDLADQ